MKLENKVLVTAQPEFMEAALHELRRFDNNMKIDTLLAPDIALCEASDVVHLMRQAAGQRPVFARHLAPVQTVVPLSNSENDVGALAVAIADLPTFALLERGQRFAVQARFAQSGEHGMSIKHVYGTGYLNQQLALAFAEETGALESIKKPQIVISLLCAGMKAYVGISLARENLSDWPGGMRHFAQLPEQISRAEFKLLEALEVFGVSLPEQGEALDLGAAPGGWTRLLLEAGMHVVAVDPARLDERLGGRLQHYRGYAEDYLQDALNRRQKFDVITNDMRMDAREAARLLVEASPCLRADGFIISTLKLPHAAIGVDPLRNLREALRLLERQFAVVQAKQLFHNRQEITVIAAQPQ
ncbi:MAG TPA: SAM-dependent methyltransferase [Ktedonobacteraceae bacterium]|nr:SAM-dependent methyltransferase [Ktedonobacteraceae bacterium]